MPIDGLTVSLERILCLENGGYTGVAFSKKLDPPFVRLIVFNLLPYLRDHLNRIAHPIRLKETYYG
jgi:hypothetical protein